MPETSKRLREELTLELYTSVGPTHDNQGVLVGVNTKNIDDALQERVAEIVQENFPGVRVELMSELISGDATDYLLVGRQADSNPYYGAGAIVNNNGSLCSAGV